MQQHQYETIIKCINFGAPASAVELINALNEVVKIANDFTTKIEETKIEETKNNK